ncbi:MAG: alpha-amylase family glycosyl hydrolase, partial [Elusimicrobia bacterium]|nr:alpha-amylase family glycosyl hydrolase [Elusimicrobiota bacterium]
MPSKPDGSGAGLAGRAGELARSLARAPYIPSSAYRLQLNRRFTFARATELLGYFADLGVDALYCSPYFQAVPGSMHGYDCVDPTRLSADIGTEEEFASFCDGLKERGLGQILDIVPNHMGIAGNANAWWLDVLENGASSAFAHVFDIDWDPVKPELKNRVLLPVLGELYGKVLEAGEIAVRYEDGALFVRYWEHRFPADPRTYPLLFEERLDELQALLGSGDPVLGGFKETLASLRELPACDDTTPSRMTLRRRDKETAKLTLRDLTSRSPALRDWLVGVLAAPSLEALHRFLEAQPYRLAYWEAAADEINHRRFFDINALAAIRIEDERVFELHHELTFKLVREGRIQGLRIDHPDGLYDPTGYFGRLQRRCLQELVICGLGRGDGDARAAAGEAAEAALREADGAAAPF